ncbi:unnamed protein product [Microthlaspi erraticum]|uniref:Uncharacterized protein n=1 Tax=Microthlaspi erraticum TaxID=1685480 RepID=A0A6D2L616_9BRAS|nr:unnamed protein product [Microthlaspi erraticum]
MQISNFQVDISRWNSVFCSTSSFCFYLASLFFIQSAKELHPTSRLTIFTPLDGMLFVDRSTELNRYLHRRLLPRRYRFSQELYMIDKARPCLLSGGIQRADFSNGSNS